VFFGTKFYIEKQNKRLLAYANDTLVVRLQQLKIEYMTEKKPTKHSQLRCDLSKISGQT
jgi:hypothetical protein